MPLRRRLIRVASLVGLVIGLWGATVSSAEMSVHFIDVGQGGGVLIQKDGKNILYDCGDTFASETVVDYLAALDIETIDVMIISHAHKDHMGGCIEVLEKLSVGTVYHNGSDARTGIWKQFQKAARKARRVEVVDKDTQADGLQILVGYDSRGKRFAKEADNSVLVRITDGKTRVLLTGDCERICEHEIIKTSDVRSEILNVGHHGSDAASSPEFLAKVKPTIAIAQAGVRNQYGHPTPTVRARIRQIGAQLYRTDFSGSIVIHSDGNTYQIETEK